MLEALWTAEFSSNQNIFGSGVVIFETDRIFGGDAQYYYTGKYEVNNGELSGNLTITHYAGEPWSIFGTVRSFNLELSGTLDDNSFIVRGYVEGELSKVIVIKLTRRADLP